MPFANISLPAAVVLLLAATPLVGAQDRDKNSAEGDDTTVEDAMLGEQPWPTLSEVKDYFLAAYSKRCEFVLSEIEFSDFTPESWELPFRYASDEADYPDRRMTLYRFPCTSGAYNFGEVFIAVREYEGIQPLQFAKPDLDIRYDEATDDFKVESVAIAGYTATDILINPGFDPEARSISEYSKWRGVGDASSSGLFAALWVKRESSG